MHDEEDFEKLQKPYNDETGLEESNGTLLGSKERRELYEFNNFSSNSVLDLIRLIEIAGQDYYSLLNP
jgi:hypothetical protein